MTGAETAAEHEAARLSDVLVLDRRGALNRCQWLRGRLSDPPAVNQRIAVAILADAAVKWQCRGASQHYNAWRQAVAEGTQLSTDRSRKFAAWHLATLMALVHVASGEVGRGELREAEPALVATLLGAVTGAPRVSG